MITNGFFIVLQVVTEFNQGGVIVQNDKYETQTADVRIVCNKEENGGTFSLFRFTKLSLDEPKATNVKFTQDVRCERKTSQSSAPWKTDPI